MRTKTSLAQHPPADMENKVNEFYWFVLRSHQRWGYNLSHILNMNETPMRFELPATRTLDFTESRTVPVLSRAGCSVSESERQKTHTKSRIQRGSAAEYQISVHKKGWMDQEGMFYLHAVCSEYKLFMRATKTSPNSNQASNNCIVVMSIMFLSTCC